MTATALALVGSLTLNVVLLWAALAARAEAAMWRNGHEYMAQALLHLKRNSHRRHPTTGKILPKGK